MEKEDDRALAHQLLGIGHRVRHHIDARLRQLDRLGPSEGLRPVRDTTPTTSPPISGMACK